MKAGDEIIAINKKKVKDKDDDYISRKLKGGRKYNFLKTDKSIVIKLKRKGMSLLLYLTSMYTIFPQ